MVTTFVSIVMNVCDIQQGIENSQIPKESWITEQSDVKLSALELIELVFLHVNYSH
jgi:hypothetical protein